MMDDPRHQRIRALVSRGLTPKAIVAIEPDLVTRVAPLVAAAAQRSEFDFLTLIAAELPLQVICALLGVDEKDRHQLLEWVEAVFDFGDARAATSYDTALAQNAGAMFEFAHELIASKRVHPTDDMLSTVIHAQMDDADPPQLTDAELASFFALLFAAGADTTRNAVAGGLLAMIEAPRQWDRLRSDRSLLPTAVEESVRWTAPSAYNRRTVTRTVQFAGCAMEPGDKVVFWEASANRDEAVFVDPMRFDVGRDPNPHVGFGHGIHHCLGAALARLEIRVIFSALLDRFERLELAAPVEWARSNKHTGIRHLLVRHVR
jgi:cytochrome P450